MMLTPRFRRHLSAASIVCGILGLPLWLMSYAWIPFRMAGADSDVIWNFIMVSELGAMLFGIIGIVAGGLGARFAATDAGARRSALRGMSLGVVVWLLIVAFNMAGLLWFS